MSRQLARQRRTTSRDNEIASLHSGHRQPGVGVDAITALVDSRNGVLREDAQSQNLPVKRRLRLGAEPESLPDGP